MWGPVNQSTNQLINPSASAPSSSRTDLASARRRWYTFGQGSINFHQFHIDKSPKSTKKITWVLHLFIRNWDELFQTYTRLHCSNPDAYSFVPVGGRDNDTFREHRPSSCQVLRQRIGDSKLYQRPETSSMKMNAKSPLLFDCKVSHSGTFFE